MSPPTKAVMYTNGQIRRFRHLSEGGWVGKSGGLRWTLGPRQTHVRTGNETTWVTSVANPPTHQEIRTGSFLNSAFFWKKKKTKIVKKLKKLKKLKKFWTPTPSCGCVPNQLRWLPCTRCPPSLLWRRNSRIERLELGFPQHGPALLCEGISAASTHAAFAPISKRNVCPIVRKSLRLSRFIWLPASDWHRRCHWVSRC